MSQSPLPAAWQVPARNHPDDHHPQRTKFHSPAHSVWMKAPRPERGRLPRTSVSSHPDSPLPSAFPTRFGATDPLPTPGTPKTPPLSALPELPQPRLRALLRSPKSLHLAQQPAQVLGARAAIVTAQRRRLRAGGTVGPESQETGAADPAPPPGFGFGFGFGIAGPCRPPHLAPHAVQ